MNAALYRLAGIAALISVAVVPAPALAQARRS